MYHLYFNICKIKFVIVLNFLVLRSGGGWRGISVSLIFSYAYIKYRDIYNRYVVCLLVDLFVDLFVDYWM